MPDRFSNTQPSLSGPASSGFAITASDTIDLTESIRALYVGGSGDVSVRMLSGETLVLRNVPGGSLLPLRITRVFATATTATDLAGLI